jgi:hypothetical protein
MSTLADYYGDDVLLIEIFDKAQAERMRDSKSSCCWGTGKIGDTPYFQLASPSPRTNKKRLVFYCKLTLLENNP